MEHDRLLAAMGLAGLGAGGTAALAGRFAGELSGLLTGYAWLVILSAAYLLLGLSVRRMLSRRTRRASGGLTPVAGR